VALRDLARCRNDPSYRIYMGAWHYPDLLHDFCHVCLAGSVMAKTLQVPLRAEASPSAFDCEVRDKLRALNSLRGGSVANFFEYLERRKLSAAMILRLESSYPGDANIDRLVKWLRKVVAQLEKNKL
jgi:hypothetical protein